MDTHRVLKSLENLARRPAFAWAVAAALGVVSMVPNRFIMNPDGISYLNLATQYLRGDWSSAVNGYWSPLYPLVLAATLRVVPASASMESTVVHALTFLIYLGTFASFRYFLSELRASRIQEQGSEEDDQPLMLTFQAIAVVACAYALFFWCALSLIGFALVTPDMIVALLLFAAAGVAIRMRREGTRFGWVGLGAIIGLAYLTKAVMFPLGIVMCLCCGVPAIPRVALRRSGLAFAGFLLVASPQLVAMSRLAGHFSYGESGTVAYANEVNRTPKFWVGLPAGSGTPEHPMRLVSRDPWAYEFSLPNTSFSNPSSDQLAYWMEGVEPRVSMAQQLGVTRRIIGWYIGTFEILVFASLALFLLRKRVTLRYVSLIVPALAAFGIYALVYAESRYVGAWVVILFLCFGASIEFDKKTRRGVAAVMGALSIFYGFSTLNLTRSEAMDAIALARNPHPHPQLETAVELQKLGIKPGSRVAGVGYLFNSYWARLAGVQIAMQVPNDTAYSAAPDSVRQQIVSAFKDAGAVAVISVGKPTAGPGETWQRLGPAGYWVLLLAADDHVLPAESSR
ncbi:MAG TPA: hypothetical protein VM166_05485 [Gemmatimonadaceae bacterium]|nr:hypothetical protein [Gemmatimonadaceae bacterium]